MPRGKAAKSGTTKATRATRSTKREKPDDEDDDWSTPSDLALTSHPAKKLHYSLDALLQEKANAPPPPPKREDDSEGEDKGSDVSMTEGEKEEGISLLSSEGFKNTAQVREILHFEDELKLLDQYLEVLRHPYNPLPMVPTFDVPQSPRGKGLKRQGSFNTEEVQEQALKTICRMFAAEELPSSQTAKIPAEDSDSDSDSDEDDLPFIETPADIAADGTTLFALIQPINDYLQKSGDALWGIGTTQQTTCRAIASWLLSLISFHPHPIVSGSLFYLFSRLLLGSTTTAALVGIPAPLSPTPSSTPRANVFWANLLSPAAFFRIWRAYGIEFVNIDTAKEEDEDSFFPPPSPPPTPSSTPSTTTTTTTTTTSLPPSEEISSTPPKSKAKTRAKKGKAKKSDKKNDDEAVKKPIEKQPPKPPTFPLFNFILTTQLLQICTELKPNSFSQQSLRSLLNQTFQMLLDEKTSNAPSLTNLFESLLSTYLQVPLNHKRDHEYTPEQQQLLRDLCADFTSTTTEHRVWVRAAGVIPIRSTPCVYLRILFALSSLHSLSSTYLVPPLTLPLPSPFSPSYVSDLLAYLCAVLDGEYQIDAVLLSVVQLLELTLGPELGPIKSSKEAGDLHKAVSGMNKRVKDAGLFGLVRTKAKDHLVFIIGLLQRKGGYGE